MDQLIDRTYEAFAQRFGHKPASGIARAPGRINIIGEHTDYNDGFVLPMAIDRHVAVAFEPTDSREIQMWSDYTGETATVKLDGLARESVPNWILYLSGMAWVLEESGHRIPGARMAVTSSLPIGAGVSSSAAFEVGIGTALAAAAGANVGPREIALLAHKSDHEFVGIPSGIMDQFASACCKKDHGLYLDCRDQTFEHVPLGSETAFVVIDTGKRRELVGGEYAERVKSCGRAVEALRIEFPDIRSLRDATMGQLEAVRGRLDERTFRRARHVITEMYRPKEMVDALAAKNWQAAGRLLYDSHDSLASDYEVSCEELDAAVEIAASFSACYGARLTGAGFGGCAIALCRASAADELAGGVAATYRDRFGKGEAYAVHASSGVEVVF